MSVRLAATGFRRFDVVQPSTARMSLAPLELQQGLYSLFINV